MEVGGTANFIVSSLTGAATTVPAACTGRREGIAGKEFGGQDARPRPRDLKNIDVNALHLVE